MTTKDFITFVKLADTQDYLYVHSQSNATQRQRKYAKSKGIKIETRKREKRWFEIDFKR